MRVYGRSTETDQTSVWTYRSISRITDDQMNKQRDLIVDQRPYCFGEQVTHHECNYAEEKHLIGELLSSDGIFRIVNRFKSSKELNSRSLFRQAKMFDRWRGVQLKEFLNGNRD